MTNNCHRRFYYAWGKIKYYLVESKTDSSKSLGRRSAVRAIRKVLELIMNEG
jgi:hypothetical protein